MKKLIATAAALVITAVIAAPVYAENSTVIVNTPVVSGNELSADESTNAPISGNQQIDNWLNARGFDYDQFKLELDIPKITMTEADLKADYAKLFKGLEANGYGEDYAFTTNYTLDAMGSFEEAFGSGLKSQFTEYELKDDSAAFLKQAQQTRDSVFATVKNSESYKTAMSNLKISSSVVSAQEVANAVKNGGVDLSKVMFETEKLSSQLRRENGIDFTIESLQADAKDLKDTYSINSVKNKVEFYEDEVLEDVDSDYDIYEEHPFDSIIRVQNQNPFSSMLSELRSKYGSASDDTEKDNSGFSSFNKELIEQAKDDYNNFDASVIAMEMKVKGRAESGETSPNVRDIYSMFGNK